MLSYRLFLSPQFCMRVCVCLCWMLGSCIHSHLPYSMLLYTHILRLNKYEFIPFHYFNISTTQASPRIHIRQAAVYSYIMRCWLYTVMGKNKIELYFCGLKTPTNFESSCCHTECQKKYFLFIKKKQTIFFRNSFFLLFIWICSAILPVLDFIDAILFCSICVLQGSYRNIYIS